MLHQPLGELLPEAGEPSALDTVMLLDADGTLSDEAMEIACDYNQALFDTDADPATQWLPQWAWQRGAGFTGTAVGALGAAHPMAAGAVDARAVDRPRMYGTGEWGARPPRGAITVLNRRPTYIVVHHTAGGNSNDFSLGHAFAISRGIQNFHMDSRGWIDSGQQLTNSRGGHITEGRHRSLEVLDQGTRHVQGAHVGGRNDETIGIENEGLYTSVNVTPQLWDSLVRLVAYIAQQYNIAPAQIRGHRDFNATQCPGGVLYRRLP